MIDKAIEQIRRLGTRGDALGACPVCGEPMKPRQDPVKVWAGRYAHGECASYVRRSKRPGATVSRRVHKRFTTA